MDILSLLGMNIHEREMSPEEVDTATCYDRTYKAFLQTAHGISPKLEKVELPSEKDAAQYVEVFFSMINPYLPIVHKGNFMTLVRIISSLQATTVMLTNTIAGEDL